MIQEQDQNEQKVRKLCLLLQGQYFIISEIQMKKQQTNEEIARVIEREQVISYKKKPTTKLHKESKDEDDEIDSAPSLKSGVFSDDSVRFNKKNTPLPELNRDKKRILSKSLMTQMKASNNYLEKEVRQHDNLVLKQKNNYLTTENMKLKTKIMNLEKENVRLAKLIEDDPAKTKSKPGIILKDHKFKGSQSLSLKMTIKNLRKELDDQKKENEKIKWSIKFTTINELECEREAILEETTRLRRLLEEEQMKRAYMKAQSQGLSHMEQKISNLNEKCLTLMKENTELSNKLKKVDEVTKKTKQLSENEKNLNKMLFNARRVIKEKEKQIEGFKTTTEKNLEKEEIVSGLEIKSSKDTTEKNQIFNTKKKIRDTDKRIMSKSAQKYRKGNQEVSNCDKCQKLIQQNELLVKKIQELNLLLKEERQKSTNKRLGDFSREDIPVPSLDETNKIIRFLKFRFKAHHLTLEQAEKYLINSENIEQAKNEEISIGQMTEYLVAEPFSIITSQYLQIFLIKLFYEGLKEGQKVKIDENRKMSKELVLKNFRNLVSQFSIMEQAKEEQMFIQVAELVTNYHQHILTALNRKRNGEGTITEEDLVSFFNQIELQKEFIDFIITQIILESLDLDHLNYYSMFEIFYMPPQQIPQEQQPPGKRKKFEVDHNQIVKEEDEEYEESRSYVEARQKTQSQRDQQELEEEGSNGKNLRVINEYEQNFDEEKPKQKEEDEYEQLFEEQKMDRVPQEQKENEQVIEDEMKPYKMEELDEEYDDDFQSPS